MSSLTDFLFGGLRLSAEERRSTEALHQRALKQREQAHRQAEKIQWLQERNHFGERIRRAFTDADGD